MKKVYRLQNLDCANCVAKMEKAISKINGVQSASVNFFMQKMTLEIAEGEEARLDTEIRAICKRIEPDCVLN